MTGYIFFVFFSCDVSFTTLLSISSHYNNLTYTTYTQVRKAVYKDLGQFIASLPSASVTKELLGEFTSLFIPSKSSRNSSSSSSGKLNSSSSSYSSLSSSPFSKRRRNNKNTKSSPSRQNNVSTKKRPSSFKKSLESSDSLDSLTEYRSIDLSEDSNTSDSISLAYAKAFPNILSVVGETRWSELKDLFDTLTRHSKSEVRCTMAKSLAHIAAILGPDLAERELLNTLDQFLQDDAKVRKQIIESLVDLLAALGPECRESYLAVLAEVMQSTANLSWRFRMLLGKQLPQLSRLFSPMATYVFFVFILFSPAPLFFYYYYYY